MTSVAVIGAGAVGGYYGARLAQAGHDVRFLMRRDFDAVRAHGLRIASVDGDFELPNPTIARTSDEIGPVDWVICALKATSIGESEDLVRPCVGPNTRIVVLMNGLGLEERFAEWFGAERIFGALAFTCINRGEPGHVHHLRYGAVTLGHLQDDPGEIDRALALWEGGKVQISAAPSLLRARWEKLCWNVPFNGLAVAGGGITTDKIVGNPDMRAVARVLMEEVVAAGNADLAAHAEATRIDGEAVITRMFDLTDAMGEYRPSTLIDFEQGRPLEVDSMFAEPLRRAQDLGVPAPRLTLLAFVMDAKNQRPGVLA